VRTFVIGDPQAPFGKVLEVLARHGAIVRTSGGDRLADDVVLISIGDHFDYDQRDPDTAGREGVQLLRWLASHDPEQVTLLLGNHDASRVMELIGFDDTSFPDARALARAGDAAAFARAYPHVPLPGTVGRDYASYCAAQRDAVIELLLAGRFRLAVVGELVDGRRALLTHAGVTTRELALLGVADGASDDARVIAAALDAQLAAAVAHVRSDWERGLATPLSLEPLHLAGIPGEEGGGLLYHRPTNPDRPDPSTISASRPRRFDARTLPAGLVQIAGHSGHAKCVFELGDWVTERARTRAHGGIRTLRVADGLVTYDLDVAAPLDGAADLILVDGELRRVPANEFDLLPLRGILS
jgi:calcineurin-like phosphoesterase family protein